MGLGGDRERKLRDSRNRLLRVWAREIGKEGDQKSSGRLAVFGFVSFLLLLVLAADGLAVYGFASGRLGKDLLPLLSFLLPITGYVCWIFYRIVEWFFPSPPRDDK